MANKKLLRSIENNDINPLFEGIKNIVAKYDEIEEALFDDLHTVLNVIKKIAGKYYAKKDEYRADDFINRIKVYLYRHVLKKIKYNKLKEDGAILLFRDVGEEFVAFLTMDEIINTMVREFPNLEIEACYFSLYEKQVQDCVDLHSSMSRLMLAYFKEQIRLNEAEMLFRSIDLLPKNLMDAMGRWSLVVEPLFFGNTQSGMALLDFNPQKGFTYKVMRRMFVFNSFRNAVYVQKILSQSHYLEDTLNKLKETRTKLIQSEKMSALGGLVAGISHEINTPIGISVTAASHLDKITKEINELFKINTMKKSDFEKYVTNTGKASMMILSNMKRAYELISSFKQVAVDQSNEQKRTFNVKEYLNQILLSLKPKLKKTQHSIDIRCNDLLEITTFPGAFSQIITNFIMNSLVHAFGDVVKGSMTIDVTTEKNNNKRSGRYGSGIKYCI